jgi:Na+-driven multidrug efflux pump
MVMIQAFNGAGDTATPTWMNAIAFWMLEIPLAWGLTNGLGWGPVGAAWAIVLAESALTAMAISMYRRGGWRGAVA